MIINFKTELLKAVEKGKFFVDKYNITVSATGKVPSDHSGFYMILEEDMRKLEAICDAADELDKKNRELERLVNTSGIKDEYDFYYPLGGGKL
jgi:hypothetical protein